MTVAATFDGRVFVPAGPVALPVGTSVTVEVADPPAPPEDSTLRLLYEMSKFPVDEDWPADGAATCKPHHRRKGRPS